MIAPYRQVYLTNTDLCDFDAPVISIGDTGILRINGVRNESIEEAEFRGTVATLVYCGSSRGLNGEIIENGRAWWDVESMGGGLS